MGEGVKEGSDCVDACPIRVGGGGACGGEGVRGGGAYTAAMFCGRFKACGGEGTWGRGTGGFPPIWWGGIGGGGTGRN